MNNSTPIIGERKITRLGENSSLLSFCRFWKGEDTMNESDFQKLVIRRLKREFPECVVMKQDAGYKQGVPDIVIFLKDRYAMLEVKRSSKATHRPNQDHYVSKFNDWSYASFVYPENVDQVFGELKEVFT